MPGVLERSSRLLERDVELDRIARRLRLAADGQGGAMVVSGVPGIGKTALLASVRGLAEADGLLVLRARGGELEREYAFGVVRQLFEPLLAALGDAERAELLAGPPGLAARLLNLPGLADEHTVSPPNAPDPSFAVLHGLYWLCVNVAAWRPTLLVVDDAHWADSPSLRFLAFLLPRLEELRMAVLLASRPLGSGEGHELLARLGLDPATEIVHPRPLTVEAVRALLASGFGVDPDPAFTQACWQATGGTPFLLRMLVDALCEAGIAPTADAAATAADFASPALSRWVRLRLQALGAEATRLARAVAVLEWAEPMEAFALAGLPPDQGSHALALLIRAGILQEKTLGFVHTLLRAAVDREMSASDRAAWHRRAAQLVAEAHGGCARIAKHLLASAPAGDPWVVDQLLAAAQAAKASGAPESAAAYLRRALAEPPSREAEADVLLKLGLAEYNYGESGWEGHLSRAVDAAVDDSTRLGATLSLAYGLGLQHRLAEAIVACEHIAPRIDAHDTESRALLDDLVLDLGQLDSAFAPLLADRLPALIERAEQPSAPLHSLAVAARVAVLANQPRAIGTDFARRVVAGLPRPELAPPLELPWFMTAVVALIFAEEEGEAQTLLDAAVSAARVTANGMLLPLAQAERAWVEQRRGDLSAAEDDARAVLQTTSMVPPRFDQLIAVAILVTVLIERGELEQAERELAPYLVDVQGTSRPATLLRHARGRLRAAQRRYAEALADFRDAGASATSGEWINPTCLPWRSEAALMELALGNVSEAQQLSAEELSLARAFGAPRALGCALRAAGLVAGDEGEPMLREAIAVLDTPRTPLDRARALVDLGALLRRSNRRVEARPLLRQAVDIAHRLGALALAERAQTELRATGAKPRRVVLSGLDALTASERRIAELAAQGLTNREIAQTLYITDRTVEGHLTHVFAKLDINARALLRGALGR